MAKIATLIRSRTAKPYYTQGLVRLLEHHGYRVEMYGTEGQNEYYEVELTPKLEDD